MFGAAAVLLQNWNIRFVRWTEGKEIWTPKTIIIISKSNSGNEILWLYSMLTTKYTTLGVCFFIIMILKKTQMKAFVTTKMSTEQPNKKWCGYKWEKTFKLILLFAHFFVFGWIPLAKWNSTQWGFYVASDLTKYRYKLLWKLLWCKNNNKLNKKSTTCSCSITIVCEI